MTAVDATARPGRAAFRGVRRWLGARPATTTILVVLLVAAAAAGPGRNPGRGIRALLGTGYEPVVEQHRWWSLVTSTFLVDSAGELLVVMALVVAVVGTAEHLMGTARTAVVFAGTAVSGTLAGIGLQSLGLRIGELWSHSVVEFTTHDPLTAIAGTATCASAFAPAFWRRRLRVVTFVACAALLLYAGQPADLYRMLAAVVGLGAGVALHRSPGTGTWTRSSHHEVRVLLAAVVAVSGAGPFLALLSGSRFGLLAPLSLLLTDGGGSGRPGTDPALCAVRDITHGCVRDITLSRIAGPGPVLVSVIPLVVLLVCALGILRGRRLAVWIAVVVEGGLALLAAYYFGVLPAADDPSVAHAAPQGRFRETAVSLALSIAVPAAVAIVLVALRRHVAVLPSRRTVVAYVLAVSGSLAALVLAAAALAMVAPGSFGLHAPDATASTAAILTEIPERFIPVDFLHREIIGVEPRTIGARIVWGGIGPLFWLVAIAGSVRAVFERSRGVADAGLVRTRTLLQAGGGEATGWMATWPGSLHWVDEQGRAAVAYRLVGRIALTLGAPVGPGGAECAVVERFARFADDNGWIPVFYGVDGRRTADFARLGWHVVGVAEETVLHPQEWSIAGRKWQDVRSSVNRAERAGIRTEWTSYQALDRATANQLAEISEQWVAEKALPEMGFTLGGLEELKDPAVRLLLAVDADGRVEAVTSWLPWFGRDGQIGWTLDFMRRRPDSMNGVMEFLIQDAAVRMRDAGLAVLSLSAAPLARSGSTAGAASGDTGALDRVLDFLGSSLEPAYGFRSLLTFKRKFQPEFRSIVMAFPDPVALPAIGLALARAYLPTLTLRQATAFVRGR